MIKVKARANESVNQMIKRFKKLCEKEGLTKDIKRNSYYESPSECRRHEAGRYSPLTASPLGRRAVALAMDRARRLSGLMDVTLCPGLTSRQPCRWPV